MDIKKKEIIKRCFAAIILAIVVAIVITIILRYQVNGETNMPFNLSKITIISTAEGQQNNSNDENYKWNFNINQSNDIYFFIDKNDEYKSSETINSVVIENIKVLENPLKGTVNTYMPNSSDGRKYVYDDRFLVTDSITYNGAKSSNEKTLEIGNQGGKVLLRFANNNIVTYKSNDDAQIVHDGTLLAKTGLKNEDIKFKVNFDFIIDVGRLKYKANITLDLPYGDILENGTTTSEKTDMSDIIFKRF